MAVDERTLEALLANPAIQFISGLLGSRNRQGSEACESLWILVHDVGEKVVRLAGDRDLLRRFGLFDSGRIQREHLHADVGGIHLGHAPVADFLKLLNDPFTAGTRGA